MKVKNIKLLSSAMFFCCLSTVSFAAPSDKLSGKYKSNEPIEISSDSLEVLQQKNQAIFTGHVIAVQGDVRLKSEKMTVLYKSTENKQATKKTASTAEKISTSAVGEKNAIDKILVEKNVFLATAGETASGAHGIYDVTNQKIYLNDNVVLTRDKNVLKGDKLVYDFATGKSVLNSKAEAGKPNQRVKALFVNEKEQKK